MNSREQLEDRPRTRRQVQERRLWAWGKRAGRLGWAPRLRDKLLKDRGKPPKDRDRAHETKSLLEHLIKPVYKGDAAAGLGRVSC